MPITGNLALLLEEFKVESYDGVVIRDPFFYCVNCNTVFVLPPWFEVHFRSKLRKDPRVFLDLHIDCCEKPYTLFLLQNEKVFTPTNPRELWVIPDTFIKSNMVADEFL